MDTDTVEWLNARGLIALVASSRPEIGDRLERVLRTPLQRGAIHARARWASIHSGYRVASGTKIIEELADWTIPAKAWRGTEQNSTFSLRLDKYQSRDKGSGFEGVECEGLTFGRAGVLAFLEVTGGAVTKPASEEVATKGRVGRPPSKADWSKFAAAFAALACDEGLEVGTAAEDIHGKIDQLLIDLNEGGVPFGIDHVRDTITLAIDYHRRKTAADK